MVIIYGSQGCGKSLAADALKNHFGCQDVVDEWVEGEALGAGDLALCQAAPINPPQGSRVISFADACMEVAIATAGARREAQFDQAWEIEGAPPPRGFVIARLRGVLAVDWRTGAHLGVAFNVESGDPIRLVLSIDDALVMADGIHAMVRDFFQMCGSNKRSVMSIGMPSVDVSTRDECEKQ